MKIITREDAIKIMDKATDHDDPYWENLTDDWYDEVDDTVPSMYDVMSALGVTKEEYDKAILKK